MANPKGEVELVIDGQAWTLKYSINVLANAEEDSGNAVADAFARLNEGHFRVADVRWLFWSALRTAHPTISQDEAGDLMQAVGLKAAIAAIGEAFNVMMGVQPERPPKRPRGRPRKVNASTGDSSGLTPLPSESMVMPSGDTRPVS